MDNKIPNHVAIIMDGNGRWAQERGLSRSDGHLAGVNNLEKLAEYIFDRGVKVLSIFAFSTENFKRSKEEVDFLMKLFIKFFKIKFKNLKKKNIKIVFSKKESGLPEEVEKAIKKMEKETENNTAGIFNICVNYGGHSEIVDVAKKISESVLEGKIKVNEIDEKTIEQNLYQTLPPIDLLIRTSGEYRISNFMLWQLAYAEMYFPKTYFPAFDEKEFDKALEAYSHRDRRFGGIKK